MTQPKLLVTLTVDELQILLTDVVISCLKHTPQRPAPLKSEPEFIDLKGACALLSYKEQTVYGLVGEGKLPHYKLGKLLRFKRTELIAFIEDGYKPISKVNIETAVKEAVANMTHEQFMQIKMRETANMIKLK